MATMIDKYGPMSLGELEICEEMLNSHGLFAMKLYVELQEVRRGHAPDHCTISLSLKRSCTLCELFDAGGLMSEVENAISLYLDTKTCLKEVRETFSGPPTALNEMRSQSVAIESTLAKAALYSTMTVGDHLRNHHTKWRARLQTAVLSTASRLGLDHYGHKSKSRGRKKLVSDSKPTATSTSSLQNLSTHETSDGRRYILLEKCKGGCCPTLDDYAALSSSFGSGVNKSDADAVGKRVGPGSGPTTKIIDLSMLKHTHQPLPSPSQATKVKRKSKISPKSDATISATAVHSAPGTTSKPTCPCSSQKLLITPEVLAAIPLPVEPPLPTHTHPNAGLECDSALSTPKPDCEISNLPSETAEMNPASSRSGTETDAAASVASSPEPEDENQEPIDDPRIYRFREQLAKFDVTRRALMEWCQAWTVERCTQIDDLKRQPGGMSMSSGNPQEDSELSRVDGQPRFTKPDRTPRCGDDETTDDDLRLDFEEGQEHLREHWQLARERQSKAQKRIRVPV